MPQIVVQNLVKTFSISERRPGLWGAFRGVIRRRLRTVYALYGVLILGTLGDDIDGLV